MLLGSNNYSFALVLKDDLSLSYGSLSNIEGLCDEAVNSQLPVLPCASLSGKRRAFLTKCGTQNARLFGK